MGAQAAAMPPEAVESRVLLCHIGGATVAFPLAEVETTIASTGLAPLCTGSQPFAAFTTHLGRAYVVVAREYLPGGPWAPPAGGKPSPFSRLVAFKNGLAVLVDDLVGIEAATAHEPLSLSAFIQSDAPPAGALPVQAYLFCFAQTQMALRTESLHHVRLIGPDEITYSPELAAWQMGEAPGVPIFGGFGGSRSGEVPILGERAHVLFVTMADGANFGLILNEGRLDDPGIPVEAKVFEVPATAAAPTCSEGVLVLPDGSHRCLVSPDRLFARCCAGNEASCEGQSAGAA